MADSPNQGPSRGPWNDIPSRLTQKPAGRRPSCGRTCPWCSLREPRRVTGYSQRASGSSGQLWPSVVEQVHHHDEDSVVEVVLLGPRLLEEQVAVIAGCGLAPTEASIQTRLPMLTFVACANATGLKLSELLTLSCPWPRREFKRSLLPNGWSPVKESSCSGQNNICISRQSNQVNP